jgi:hypothetical protein
MSQNFENAIRERFEQGFKIGIMGTMLGWIGAKLCMSRMRTTMSTATA